MSAQIIRAVIGKGFGDEGKGLATDYFCSQSPNTLVVKHNGGAQAGHTVESEGKRFVFHQLSAGSFRHSDTFWADSYYPDLYKLREETAQFEAVSGFCPKIRCDKLTNVTLIDDVLINLLLETSRGQKRHGSCGMGINECDLRTKAGFGLTVMDFLTRDATWLIGRIMEIRKEYGRKRLTEAFGGKKLSENGQVTEYLELLKSRTVVENAVEEMVRNAYDYVAPCDDAGAFLKSAESIVFESGQGLLLDSENRIYAPHVSASRTGLFHPGRILSKFGLSLTEAVYVTRTYVTRHGAGPLPHECPKEKLGILLDDETNVTNPWQGTLRYAVHGDALEFVAPIDADLKDNAREKVCVSLFLTHLNETGRMILMADGDKTYRELKENPAVREVINRWYLSDEKDAGKVICD